MQEDAEKAEAMRLKYANKKELSSKMHQTIWMAVHVMYSEMYTNADMLKCTRRNTCEICFTAILCSDQMDILIQEECTIAISTFVYCSNVNCKSGDFHCRYLQQSPF
jgi:hypothetical protein